MLNETKNKYSSTSVQQNKHNTSADKTSVFKKFLQGCGPLKKV